MKFYNGFLFTLENLLNGWKEGSRTYFFPFIRMD